MEEELRGITKVCGLVMTAPGAGAVPALPEGPGGGGGGIEA